MLPLGWEQQGVLSSGWEQQGVLPPGWGGVLPSDWELVHPPVMEGPAHLFLEVANNGQLVGMLA